MKNFFNKLNNIKIFLIIAAGFIILGVIGGAYGYYFHKNQFNGHAEASNFYFDSDFLTEEGKTYNLSVGTTSVTFELRNFADSLRYAENDISYEVFITNNAKLNVTNSTDSDSSESKVVSTLLGNEKSTHLITISGLENGKEYTVTAVSNSGYKRTLSATFVVRDIENNFYQRVNENDPYVTLTIWTENISGEVTIEFPDGLIPDNTCEGMENVLTNSGSFTITCGVYSSYEFRFFKETGNTETYNFNVSLKTAENEIITAIKK